eukprot:1187217-Prorocentrum_minimum.AAC.2
MCIRDSPRGQAARRCVVQKRKRARKRAKTTGVQRFPPIHCVLVQHLKALKQYSILSLFSTASKAEGSYSRCYSLGVVHVLEVLEVRGSAALVRLPDQLSQHVVDQLEVRLEGTLTRHHQAATHPPSSPESVPPIVTTPRHVGPGVEPSFLGHSRGAWPRVLDLVGFLKLEGTLIAVLLILEVSSRYRGEREFPATEREFPAAEGEFPAVEREFPAVERQFHRRNYLLEHTEFPAAECEYRLSSAGESLTSAALPSLSERILEQSANMSAMHWSQALWKPGTMALRRTFHISRSAGINPVPMMGSRISARMPLSNEVARTRRISFAATGSDTTMNALGPNASL